MVLLKKTDDKRPVFLNLFKIQLPLSAFVSIMHRVTGVVMILCLPILVFLLYAVVGNPSLIRYVDYFPVWMIKGISAIIVIVYMYHVIAGIRHLFHDFTGSHSLGSTLLSARFALFLWGVWIVLTGYKLWR